MKKWSVLNIVTSICLLGFGNAIAAPTGGVVSAGQATISSPSANTTQIRQSSQKAVVDWQSYNVGKNEQVNYQQPNTKSITLNRINPSNGVSQIYGKITANGQVWLINPAGIWFGPSAYVNVSGLVATTANVTNNDFMNGNYHFLQSPYWNGAVVNEGMIVVMNAGLAALVGPGVVNNGQIVANLGMVVLGASNEFTIDFNGDSLINFAVGNDVSKLAQDKNGHDLSYAVQNGGRIIANGGKIQMTSNVASRVLDKAINMKGIAVADSVHVKNGEIIFSAGDGTVSISGTVRTAGKKQNQTGGTIKVLAQNIKIENNAVLDTTGKQGGGTILVGSHGQTENVSVDAGATLLASATQSGNGGKVIVWSDLNTVFNGRIEARGGSTGGNGGFVETSGKYFLEANNASIDLTAPKGVTGTWLLDPVNIYIATNLANATSAGMTGTDNTASYASGNTFSATGAVQDSLLTTSALTTALASANIVVTTTDSSGTGVGNITVVDPISWSSANNLTLTAANNIFINAAITTGASGSTLILNATGNVTQTAAIGGLGGLTKQGNGTLTLSQANTYSGTTTISAGTVIAQNNTSLGNTTGATTIASGAMLEVSGSGLNIAEAITSMIGTGVSSGGALRNLANSNEWSGAITLGAGGATINSDAGTFTLSGGISGATRPLTIGGSGNTLLNSVLGTTTGTLIKQGNGVLTMTAANTYSGATSVNGGQLTFSGNGSATSTAISVATNAKLTLDNTTTNVTDRIANALTLTGSEFEMLGNNAANSSESIGTLTLSSGYSTVTITPDASFNTQVTFASLSRTNGAGILFRGKNLGANTVASLTANNSNIIFTSAPTLTGGGGNSGTTTVSIIAGAIGSGGATGNVGTGDDFVTYNPTGGSVNGLRPLLSSEYASTPAANVNLKLTANRTADDTFSINSLLLSGGVTYNFDNTAGANTITLGSGALSGNLLSIGGSNVIQTTTSPSGGVAFGSAEAKIFAISNLTFGSNVPVTGTGSLTKHGSGTLLENRSVAISGGLRITNGILRSGINNAYSTAQALTILPNGTLDLNGFNNSITTLTVNSGATSGSIITMSGGTLTLGGNVTLSNNGSGAVGAAISGNLALGGTTRTFTIADGLATNDLSISALISDGTAGISKAGAGDLSLTGPNTYAGVTTVSAGTLEAGNATALGDTTNGTTVGGTLIINNAAIGVEAITLNNGGVLSGTGVASLSGNITLGGSAANRTISAVSSSDTLTLNGTIDGGASALTVSGSGTTVFGNTVGATTALTSFTTSSGSTLNIDGGGIRTSGAQTYNGIVNMTNAAAVFEVTGASADILMINTANNITQNITYSATGSGSFRDITLANSAATAVIPTLPSGLRNLSLTFTNAGMTLPALTLSGTLGAAVAGGNLTQSGSLVISGVTTLVSGAYNVTLLDAGNNFSSLTVNGGVNVSVQDSNAIVLGGATAAVSGNYSVTAGGTITDSARISANILSTSSVGGTTLDFPNHTISNFDATNITSGGISLTTNVVPLTLTGINQSGTTVTITNVGTVSVPNGVTINSGTSMAITADDLNLNTTGAITSGATTSITQRLAGASIGLGNTAGNMTISGAELQRITATGLTITNSTDGAIFVDGITSANTNNISGTITISATTGTLGTVSFINNPSSFRTLTVSGDNGISIANNLSTTVGALSLTSAGSSVSVADAATATSATTLSITANDLNLNSTGALTSTTTMSVTQNVASGSIGLGLTSGTMTVSGSELQRMTATGLTFNNATDGAITVDGISSAESANISGTIALTATTGTLGTVSFINNGSSFRTLTASGDAGISINANVTTTVGTIGLTSTGGTVSVADGATALSNTTLTVAANDLNLNSSGALTSTTTMSISENIASGSIGLGNTAGTMTIDGNELQHMTATGLTITNASDGIIIVDGITSANSANISGTTTLNATTGTLGNISFTGGASSFRTLTGTADNSITLDANVATTVGALTFTVNNGNFNVSNGVNGFSNTSIAVTANDINLNSTGSLTSTTTIGLTQNVASGSIGLGNAVGTMSLSNAELLNLTGTALTITAPSNGSILLDNVTSAATANISGSVNLTSTTGVGLVNAQGNSTFGNPLVLAADTVTVDNGVTLATNSQTMSITAGDINLNATGALSSGTSSMTITQQNAAGIGVIGLGNATGSLTLDNVELQHITAGTLGIMSGTSGGIDGTITVDGVSAVATSGIAGLTTLTAIAGTGGSITFQNANSTFTNGVTLNTDNAVTINNGVTLATNNSPINITATTLNLNTSGIISSGSNDITITARSGTFGLGAAAGTMTLNNSTLQRLYANNLTLANANNGAILVDGVNASDFVNISNLITLNAINGATSDITFQGAASSFPVLTANATNSITVNVELATTFGNLFLNSNTTGTTGPLFLNADLTSANDLTLTSPSGAGITVGASVNLTGNQINISDAIDGNFNLVVNALGNLTFVGNVGSVTPLNSLTVFANNVTGTINVAALALDTNFANLFGFVNGHSGEAAIQQIALLNTITAGTHFFDSIDMYQTPVPPIPPTPPFVGPTAQTIFGAYVSPNSGAYQPSAMSQPEIEVNDDSPCSSVTSLVSVCNFEEALPKENNSEHYKPEKELENHYQWHPTQYGDSVNI